MEKCLLEDRLGTVLEAIPKPNGKVILKVQNCPEIVSTYSEGFVEAAIDSGQLTVKPTELKSKVVQQ